MAENFIFISQVAVFCSFVWNIIQGYEFVTAKLRRTVPPVFSETTQLLIEQQYTMIQQQGQVLAEIRAAQARRKRKTRRGTNSSTGTATLTLTPGFPRARRPSIIAILEQ